MIAHLTWQGVVFPFEACGFFDAMLMYFESVSRCPFGSAGSEAHHKPPERLWERLFNRLSRPAFDRFAYYSLGLQVREMIQQNPKEAKVTRCFHGKKRLEFIRTMSLLDIGLLAGSVSVLLRHWEVSRERRTESDICVSLFLRDHPKCLSMHGTKMVMVLWFPFKPTPPEPQTDWHMAYTVDDQNPAPPKNRVH